MALRGASDGLAKCARVYGQSMAEYLWLSSLLMLALAVPWLDGQSPADALLDAITNRIERFVWWIAVL